VFSPSLSDGGPGSTAFRGLDQLHFQISPVSDQGRGRWSELGLPGTTRLLRDGEVIGESGQATHGVFEVGQERAEYTVRTAMDRTGQAGLTTRYEAAWTFTSQRGDQPLGTTYLPLLAVRFSPVLDDHNAARAGRAFTIPVSVQRNGTTTPGPVSTPVVEVSYDDGTTWTATTVSRDRDRWTVTVHHPAGAEHVSLRSTVGDADGNTQRQTIIRAYALR
jgi:hypothetical protein